MLRNFGKTGLKVYPLGFGGGEIGDHSLNEKDVEKILNSAIDLGINLIDTARGYGASEERIGKYLSHRRDEFIISTKVGYGIPGYQDWTYDCIIAGVNEALRLMKTDFIDIVHLHSCSIDILKNNYVIDALEKMKESGKIKTVSYAGEWEPLIYAINTNRFDSIQTSINVTDQWNLNNSIPLTTDKKMGVIAKRSIANAPWRFDERPVGNYAEEYWLRWKEMDIKTDYEWLELFLRFTAFADGVDSCIIGTTNIEHLKRNVAIVQKGKLPDDVINLLKDLFIKHGNNWGSQL
ncbi:MAG TPA: aldo/keto reductase [Ignavibacteriaceae bacterium]|nr:aldo/keto reductase [Ignavibacteriaceae bacterium]